MTLIRMTTLSVCKIVVQTLRKLTMKNKEHKVKLKNINQQQANSIYIDIQAINLAQRGLFSHLPAMAVKEKQGSYFYASHWNEIYIS